MRESETVGERDDERERDNERGRHLFQGHSACERRHVIRSLRLPSRSFSRRCFSKCLSIALLASLCRTSRSQLAAPDAKQAPHRLTKRDTEGCQVSDRAR